MLIKEKEEYGYINIFLDIEGTGWSMKDHAMVQIGAVVTESTGSMDPSYLDVFQVLINIPPERSWCDRCVNEFWTSSPELKATKLKIDNKEGLEPTVAMQHFANFMQSTFQKYANSDINRIRIITDTVSYDAGK